jgi:hypothetical protein
MQVAQVYYVKFAQKICITAYSVGRFVKKHCAMGLNWRGLSCFEGKSVFLGEKFMKSAIFGCITE